MISLYCLQEIATKSCHDEIRYSEIGVAFGCTVKLFSTFEAVKYVIVCSSILMYFNVVFLLLCSLVNKQTINHTILIVMLMF